MGGYLYTPYFTVNGKWLELVTAKSRGTLLKKHFYLHTKQHKISSTPYSDADVVPDLPSVIFERKP